MKTVVCYKCKMAFGLPDEFYQTAKQMCESLTWYCPAGHPQVFLSGESEATKLRRERDRLRQQMARLEDEKKTASDVAAAALRSAAAYKGAATRMKNRAKAGVCPCCNRHFVNLERHMRSQHSDEDLTNVVELGQAAKA